MKFRECLKEGLIKKDEKAKERIEESIKIAERFYNSAINNFKIQEYEIVEIAAYNSLFHCCRALLFSKGYKERSHYCLIIALKELFRENKKIYEILNSIDKVRLSRHNVQYGGALVDEEEAKFIISLAEEFISVVKEILL